MVPGWSAFALASVVTGGYVRHLARGYAMLMTPDEDETAVPWLPLPGLIWLCAFVRY